MIFQYKQNAAVLELRERESCKRPRIPGEDTTCTPSTVSPCVRITHSTDVRAEVHLQTRRCSYVCPGCEVNVACVRRQPTSCEC